MDNSQTKTMTPLELKEYLNHLGSRALLPSTVLLLFGLVQIFRENAHKTENLIILIGSILSIGAILGYSLLVIIRPEDTPTKLNKLRPFIALSGLIPWLYSIYLVLIPGFWSLRSLVDDFSFIVILKAVFFITFGYAIILNSWKITEVGRQIDEGKIQITL